MSKRISLFVSVGLIVIALASGGVVTALFLRDTFPKMTHQIAEFSPNTPRVIFPEHQDLPLSLAAVVNDVSSPAPEAVVSIRANGEEVPLRDSNQWASIMGRDYRYFGNFGPVDGEIEILIEADPAERFVVLYHPQTVLEQGKSRAMPGWIASASLFFIGTIALLWSLTRTHNITPAAP